MLWRALRLRAEAVVDSEEVGQRPRLPQFVCDEGTVARVIPPQRLYK
jgi:hypothetical protein